MSTLQSRLEEVMKAKSWTRGDVQRISKQSSSLVSQWLGNTSKPIQRISKVEAAEALAAASGFSAVWIATGKGQRRPHGGLETFAPQLVQDSGAAYGAPTLRAAIQALAGALEPLTRSQRDEVVEVFALLAKHPDRAAYVDLLAGMLAPAGAVFEKQRGAGG